MRAPPFAATMMMTLAVAFGVACGGQVGEARSQWVIHVHTDAPVPQLGDRVLVEVLAPDASKAACSGCRRLFGLEGPSAWPLSFGIPDNGVPSQKVRIRLFRSDHSDAGGAPAEGLPIDLLGTLPDTGGGVKHLHVALWTTCAGVAADLAHGLTCTHERDELVPLTFTEGGEGESPAPGSFALARPQACSRPAREGMVCIEGGLFARGDSTLTFNQEALSRASPERLVRLSPFALDIKETTVREMRALIATKAVDGSPRTHEANPACTYTEAPGAFEDFPVSCISRDLAVKSCAARGKRLPTEAEWEYAAGDRDQERRYPWGGDVDVCHYAIIGRGRVELEGTIDYSSACRGRSDAEPYPWGPRPVGESLDVTTLGIHDLGGNVSEWVADAVAASYESPCFEGPRILTDPRCDAGSTYVLARGGNWRALPIFAQVVTRLTYVAEVASGISSEIGVRCAESL